MNNHIQTAGDVVAGSTIVASLMGWLPPMAALMAILWYMVLFYDRFKGKKNDH